MHEMVFISVKNNFCPFRKYFIILNNLQIKTSVIHRKYVLPGGPYNNNPFHGDSIPLNNCGY